MKKTLIAAAVLGMFAASVASAQTANVTLYGRMNVSVESVSSKDSNSMGKIQRITSNDSRFGIRGSEDLGGGLSAIFQVESEIDADTSGAGLASRDTWAGLQGSWGSVKLGRMLTPYDALHGIWGNNTTALSSILSTKTLWSAQSGQGYALNFAGRPNNSIRYDSANLNGLTFAAQLSVNENDRDTYLYSANVIYSKDALQLGAAVSYRDYGKDHGGGFTGDESDLGATITAGYDFGFIRPAVVYEYAVVDDGDDSTSRHLAGLSLTAPIGAGKLYVAGVYATKWRGDAGEAKSGAWQAEVSYTYALSKRTSVYAGYAMIQNDKNAYYGLGSGTYAVAPKTSGDGKARPNGVVFGMIHNF
ncbi:MAG: porin [Burkholderiales bacterium]|nr:porin [Burkholderiales bacterium]